MALAIGVDIGGTNVRAALVSESGAVVRSVRERLGGRSPADVMQQLDGLLQTLDMPSGEILPMAVGLPAMLQPDTGFVTLAPNLDWVDVPFGAMLSARLGRAVRLVNDVNAIAVGEAACGAGGGATDVICVFVGTGVGMGAVCHGRILEGSHGFATELGHIKIATSDGALARLCGCGARGCLEAYAGGRHLPELIETAIRQGAASRLLAEVKGDLTELTSHRIEAAAQDGDPAASRVWDDIATRLGMAIGNAVTLFNPSVVVLGGGVLTTAPSLREKVSDRIRLYAGRVHREHLVIAATSLGDDAGIIGTGVLAHQLLRA